MVDHANLMSEWDANKGEWKEIAATWWKLIFLTCTLHSYSLFD